MREGLAVPWPNCAAGTSTTALCTWTFLYTVMLVTFTTVVGLTTSSLTTRGPPQPPHHVEPGAPRRSVEEREGKVRQVMAKLTKEDVLKKAEQLKNWGKWGPDDQL